MEFDTRQQSATAPGMLGQLSVAWVRYRCPGIYGSFTEKGELLPDIKSKFDDDSKWDALFRQRGYTYSNGDHIRVIPMDRALNGTGKIGVLAGIFAAEARDEFNHLGLRLTWASVMAPQSDLHDIEDCVRAAREGELYLSSQRAVFEPLMTRLAQTHGDMHVQTLQVLVHLTRFQPIV